jgi:DNA-binding CsgD family transcriptional regulator
LHWITAPNKTAVVMWVEGASVESGEDGEPPSAAAPALDLVMAEVKPLAASLLVVGPDGTVRCRDARASLLTGDARRELDNWHRHVGARAPLAADAVNRLGRPVVSFADLGEERDILMNDPILLAAYRRIGAIDDLRLMIRDAGRLVAMIAVWRPLHSMPWTAEARRRLESVQPLVEMAWLAAPRPGPELGLLPGADLTPRQREVAALLAGGATNPEVARALGISRNTAKTHARAVLTKLGAGSRRELLLALRGPAATP